MSDSPAAVSNPTIQKIWSEFSVELISAASVLAYILVAFVYVNWPWHKGSPRTFSDVTIFGAAYIFLVGQFYGRQKDRREAKRNRALALFNEFHSAVFRVSRRYISRWLDQRGNGSFANSPGLKAIELASGEAYIRKGMLSKAEQEETQNRIAELDDPELIEEHFFAIYQFFERWALAVKNGDIAEIDADRYMSSYKAWYVDTFVRHWYAVECDSKVEPRLRDEYIKRSLERILKYVVRDKAFQAVKAL